MKKLLLKRKLLFFISSSIFLVDQLSKASAIHILSDKYYFPVVPHIIHFRLVKNTGAAFSLFNNATPILSFLSLVVSLGLIALIYQTKPLPIWKGLGISFLLGGCIGNGLDRWRLGYVHDFIELIPINFPIFNFADIAINLAVLFLLIEAFSKRKIHST